MKAEQMDDYDRGKFEKGRYSYMTRSFLNELCFRGKLEPGEYLINVSW